MGKRKKGYPSIEDVLDRPWCYYCERDFDDLKILISHQKAKHFKCDRCGRRLNTAGGLSVHLNQVHKEQLSSVENALPNRQGLEVEIFGMEGIPEDVMQTHNQRVMQQYYEAAAERRAKSGNLMPGEQSRRKKIKVETAEELKKRFQLWRESGGVLPPSPATSQQDPAQNGNELGTNDSTQVGALNPTPFTHSITGQPATVAGLPFVPGQGLPGAPLRHPPDLMSTLHVTGLPPRPIQNGGPGSFPAPSFASNGAQSSATAADVDDLIASVTGQAGPTESIAQQHEKKIKKDKDKNTRLVYSDNDISPEEKLAATPQYAFTAV